MHGLTGGSWKRSKHSATATEKNNPTRNRAVPNGSVTYHRTTPPRQLPTLLRHGVSKAVFSAVDDHAWGRLMRWIRAKYAGKHRLVSSRECTTGFNQPRPGIC